MVELLLIPTDGSLRVGFCCGGGYGQVVLMERLVEQKGRIFSYKYHWRAKSKPLDKSWFGWSLEVGLSPLRIVNCFSGDRECSQTNTVPG